ncbi:septum formation initiator family protein [Chloroflexi bacterium TSY]|nr:septum formation initiator family protein [Chloroflexi bacterium TSY]
MTTQNRATEYELNKRNPRLFLFILIGLCILFSVSYAIRLVERMRVSGQVELWQHRIEDAMLRQASLNRYAQFMTSDSYVESVARDELGLAREGDSVVVLIPPPNQNTEMDHAYNESDVAQSPLEISNWKLWMSLFVQ